MINSLCSAWSNKDMATLEAFLAQDDVEFSGSMRVVRLIENDVGV